MDNQIANQPSEFNQEEAEQEYNRIMPLAKKEKLKELIIMALEKGVVKAVFVAKKLGDPYLLDELHDALADELKQRLITEGRLEKL